MSKTKIAKKKVAKKVYGPDIYKRNEHGLLQNVDYVFNEDGSVNWRAMIKEEFLYPNKGWFDSRNQPVPTSPEGLEDKQLLIMLGGIKELAKMRGYSTVAFDVVHSSDDYVTAKCMINWNKNYETQDEVVYEDYANATLANTDNFCAKFLETIACNRAFVRCVRNYLNIHIVGADEIDRSGGFTKSSITTEDAVESNIVPVTPTAILEKTAREKLGVSNFEDFKNHLRDLWKSDKYRNDDAQNWGDFSDISAKEARLLLAVLSKK
tara:strand:- start:4159 stop:4953 length:795 start_codon:yes stop_codon:yes gene_type:complete